MRRKTRLDNINVVSNGLQFTFDSDSEAEEFYRECLNKSTNAEIEGSKVTLIMTGKITKTGEMNSPA